MNSTFHCGPADSSPLSHTVARWKIHLLVGTLAWVAILVAAPAFLNAEVVGILCTDGEGMFTAKSMTGVTVTVSASKTRGLASRSCGATLSYRGKTIDAVDDASQVDIDLMDADIDRGGPIVGIQYTEPGSNRQMTYAIYRLDRTLQLLRTIKGGDFFRAADFHLDKHIEIRTGDVTAADGFDGIPLSSFDFAPTMYLQFEDGKLIDVSSEFRSEYDRTIADLKAALDPASLKAFKSTNGKLDSIYLRPADEIHSLTVTKIKVLELVWSYIYSGREAEAWSTLNEMWPAEDVDRIRAAILEAQQRGIRKQVDSVSTSVPHLKISHVLFYETATVSKENASIGGQISNGDSVMANIASAPPEDGAKRAWIIDIDPTPIYLYTGCLPSDCPFLQGAGVRLDLRLDDAGKVVEAKPVDNQLKGSGIDALLKSALTWKFIPAYKNGHPVACVTQQIINLYR